jgi:hypothetical protein
VIALLSARKAMRTCLTSSDAPVYLHSQHLLTVPSTEVALRLAATVFGIDRAPRPPSIFTSTSQESSYAFTF